ncbi:MAG: hypothetical protein A3K18_09215 [Lentisphaerae bacterium RIFOXYA12_64_32]|nr:MAG: hypothetical protein A3K18_09215 [Lentisphaerae bacterium RIFOXYA12_64_32]
MIESCGQPMFALLLLVLGIPPLAQKGEPTDQVRQTTETVLAIVQAPNLKGPGNDAERQKRMKQAVDERFDWAAMARGVIGRQWRELSDAQRTELSGLFSELIARDYISKVESYSGEKILYKGDRVDGKRGVVVVVVTVRGAEVPVSYRVLKKGTEWLVYDVIIGGKSMANNCRSQMGVSLDHPSYDDLISGIRAKIAESAPEQGEKKSGATTEQKSGKGAR